jgi:hypothetical protein
MKTFEQFLEEQAPDFQLARPEFCSFRFNNASFNQNIQ